MRFLAITLIISFALVSALVQGNGQEGGSGSGSESGRRRNGNWNDTCGIRSTLDSKCSISGAGPPGVNFIYILSHFFAHILAPKNFKPKTQSRYKVLIKVEMG